MRLALSDGVPGTRTGARLQSRGRVVARASAEGELNDVLGGFLDSINSSVQATPTPAPAAPAPAPSLAQTPQPPTPPAQHVVPSQPDLPSIESLAQRVEYPSSKVASTVPPAPAVDVNPLQPFMDALTNAEAAVEAAFDDTAETIIENFNSIALPPSLQSKLDSIASEYAGTKESFDDAPEVYLFLFSLLIGAAGYTYYRNEFGGFSGIYKPTELVEALTKEDNIILVDIRSEEEQERSGVLDLRRAARSKAVSLPIVEVPDAVKGDVRNKSTLQRKLSAALVCSLANVNAFTKIVLMDTRGGTTKALAREISSQGYRAYCLKGGYTLWSRVGLATKKGTYDVTAADLLADKKEELGEAATSTAQQLKKPQNAFLVLLGFVGLGTTVAYPHESFQFFGFVGLQLTVIVKLLSFDKPADAVAALKESSRSFAGSLGSAADKATSVGAQLRGPAAAAGAAVASAASKASSATSKIRESAGAAVKGDSAIEEDKIVAEAAAVQDSKPEDAPVRAGSMFVKASADKPAAAMPAPSPPAPSMPAGSVQVAPAEDASAKAELPAASDKKPDTVSKPAAEKKAPTPPAPSKPVASTTSTIAEPKPEKKEAAEKEKEAAEKTPSTPTTSTPVASAASATSAAVEQKPDKKEAAAATPAAPTKPVTFSPAAAVAKKEPVKPEPSAAKPKTPAPTKPVGFAPPAVPKDKSSKMQTIAEPSSPDPYAPVMPVSPARSFKEKLAKKELSEAKKEKKDKRDKWPDAVAEAAAEAAAIAQDVPKPVVEIVDSDKEKAADGGKKITNGSKKGDVKSKKP